MPKIAYTDEFKRDAVALVASGIPQKQVAKDMGMAKTALRTCGGCGATRRVRVVC